MEIYLDNAATTKAAIEIAEKATELMLSNYGNPSSPNIIGIRVEREIKEASEKIMRALRLDGDLYFTSGGTESNNLAVFGAVTANSRKRKRIITTRAEHPSVSQCMDKLINEGYKVEYVGVDRTGAVRIDELKDRITEDTVLVSVMHVNNETGAVNDIAELGSFMRGFDALFHSDGVQGFGKLVGDAPWGVDLYSLSAHKIHGLKGAGALYVGPGIRISPMMYGGGQQGAIRPGTENTIGIVTFGMAAKLMADGMVDNYRHVKGLRDRLVMLVDTIDGVTVNGNREVNAKQSPYILNMSFEGVRNEVLLRALEQDGVYTSSGSACGSRKKGRSALEMMGFGSERAESAVRFSFSKWNTIEEIDRCAESLEKNVKQLRRVKRG